jgi:hypothetical protein
VKPLGLGNRALERYIIYFFVVVSALPLGVGFGIGATNDYEDCAVGWESFGFACVLLFCSGWVICSSAGGMLFFEFLKAVGDWLWCNGIDW